MRKQTAGKKQKPTPKRKRFRTTLNLPEDLWKATKVRAIKLGVDAQELVALAIEQYLKKGGAR